MMFGDMISESELRLEIGRYDAGSFRSSVRFFSNGRTMAILLRLGSFVWCVAYANDDWGKDNTSSFNQPGW